MSLHLIFEQDEQICMYTSDNRPLHMRCSKNINGLPTIDLLPKVRYQIKAMEKLPAAVVAFETGLLISPDTHSPEHVIVANLSDKVVRVMGGADVFAVESDLESKAHARSDTGSNSED